MKARIWMAGLALATGVLALRADEDGTSGGTAVDRDAMNMYRRGMALLTDRQDDRAVKVFEGVLLNFPGSPVRHLAAMEIGHHCTAKGDYENALRQFSSVLAAEDADAEQQAEALFRTGACHYEQGDTARALSFLRQVTENYPWSNFSNEAYYYIGLCHFQAKRWTRAVEAFRMVGTRVEPMRGEFNLAEAGQRYMIRVEDKDLRVLGLDDKAVDVVIETASGDRETIPLEVFDREGEVYLGSIKTASAPPVPGDDMLQFTGQDTVTVTYLDRNTHEGERNVKRQAVSRLVSTATVGFMDGAFREYVKGVFAAHRTFLQVRDFDQSGANQPGRINVRVYSQYRPTEQELADRGIRVNPEDGPYYVLHDEKNVTLAETEPRSGIFTAMINIDEVADTNRIVAGAANLQAVAGDHIFMDYIDGQHRDALDAPRTVTARAEFLTGEIPDVWIAQREVQDPNLRARKNNIEAAFYLRLGSIFKSVGLIDRVEARVLIGLEKVNEVIRQSLRISIDRDGVEEAYRLKWELQVLGDDLAGAVATCRTFMSVFPDSQLADLALLQIAKASMAGGDTRQAFSLFQGILQLNTTEEIKGEAQYNIALLLEEESRMRASSKEEAERMMGPAIAAYQRVTEQYPNSPFAGEALGKVIDFYLAARDFARCAELLDRVFVDYPDAPFLDEMLLKWGVMLVRMNQHDDARGKLQQLLRDYPNSAAAAQAKPLIDRIATLQAR